MGDGGVKDFKGRVFFEEFVADSLDKVSFAETGTTVEEERVVTVARGIDNATGGGDGEIVVGADDEVV